MSGAAFLGTEVASCSSEAAKLDDSAGPSLETEVKQLRTELANLKLGLKNKAYVFIKPHAVTPEVEDIVRKKFAASGVKIVDSGEIGAQEIDDKLLVDTHYGAIASKAVKLDPTELVVSEKAKGDFEKMSGMSWEDALKAGKVLNAKQYCEKMGVTGDDVDAKWSTLTRGENLIKFGGGFYCGDLDGVFVINGFYMSMRAKYTAPGKKIKYFLVEFSPLTLSWGDFRTLVLGGTDPATAAPNSLRNEIYQYWEKLGLSEEPNTGDNGVHASASPFEAFAERVNWLGLDGLDADIWGKTLLLNGVSPEKLKELMGDASVEYEGTKQSIFDLLEDLDSEECLAKFLDIVNL